MRKPAKWSRYKLTSSKNRKILTVYKKGYLYGWGEGKDYSSTHIKDSWNFEKVEHESNTTKFSEILESPDYVRLSPEELAERRIENRKRRFRRASQNVHDLIYINFDSWNQKPKFITLTFPENVVDMEYAKNEFKKFIKRYNYRYSTKVVYLAVVEFQQRGSIHFHAIFFNQPYIDKKELTALWGFSVNSDNIKGLEWNDGKVAHYMSKYFSKMSEDPRLDNVRCFFTSRNILRPTYIRDSVLVSKELKGSRPQNVIVYQNEFDTIEKYYYY